MNIDQLNYAAFNEPLTASDKQQFRPPQTTSGTVLKVIGFMFAIFVSLFMFSISFALLSSTHSASIPSIIFNKTSCVCWYLQWLSMHNLSLVGSVVRNRDMVICVITLALWRALFMSSTQNMLSTNQWIGIDISTW